MADDGGLARFQQRMQAVPRAAREAVAPVLVKSAEDIAATMRVLVPVDQGDLEASITVTEPGQATPPYSQPGGSVVVPALTSAVTAGNSDARYAHLVEYGHSNGLHGSEVPPHPFFWPGFRMARGKALRRIKRTIGKAIKEAK